MTKRYLLLAAAMLSACSQGVDDAAVADTPATSEPVAEVQVETAPALITLADAIANPRRADDANRDRFRRPGPTLDFFDVEPGMRVAEIWPGWYTQILAPYYSDKDGSYVAVLFPDGVSERVDARNVAFKDKFGDANEYGDIEYASFSGDTGLSVEDGSLDMILTFRNVHNWMGGGYADAAFQEFYDALKPGGVLGVVEHRLPETQTQDPRGATGYVQESYMKALAADAGFEFVEGSEVNANPLDTADHPLGVWTLPPRSRVPDAGTPEANGFDAELYLNIGESDRATLKFRKPG